MNSEKLTDKHLEQVENHLITKYKFPKRKNAKTIFNAVKVDWQFLFFESKAFFFLVILGLPALFFLLLYYISESRMAP